MALSKERMRELKKFKCPACHRIGYLHHHHLSYEPEKVIEVCASCHKKIHMYLNNTVRNNSNPYINPLVKLGIMG